jgi:inorganic pyrophosphatase
VAVHPWHDIELPSDLTGNVPAVIEIPTGSKVKYELDKRSGMLIVDRILFSAVHYPANYGFVPRTFCGDGDPLDILVLCQEPIVPLAIMQARPIGVMKMRDDKGEDDKLIAVHADDPEYAGRTGCASCSASSRTTRRWRTRSWWSMSHRGGKRPFGCCARRPRSTSGRRGG